MERTNLISCPTTLLRCLLGLLRPDEGRFLWDGRDLSALTRRARARLMAYVPQSSALTFPYEVQEVVLMGRVAHLGLGNAPGREDRRKAALAMERLEIGHLRGHVFQHLSGGERQMVLMARALALTRSEERRVGKECRSRWSPYH